MPKYVDRTAISRICKLCNKEKPLDEFQQGGHKDYKLYTCKECYKIHIRRPYQQKWRDNMSDELREKRNAENMDRYFKKRRLCFEHYGMSCECCSEAEELFLTIDHINNDGAEHRRKEAGNDLYGWLVKHNFPEGFRTLCHNCNTGRYRNGGVCPHQEASQASAEARSSKRSEKSKILNEDYDMVEAVGKLTDVNSAVNWGREYDWFGLAS